MGPVFVLPCRSGPIALTGRTGTSWQDRIGPIRYPVTRMHARPPGHLGESTDGGIKKKPQIASLALSLCVSKRYSTLEEELDELWSEQGSFCWVRILLSRFWVEFSLDSFYFRPITRRVNGFLTLRAAVALSQPYPNKVPLLLPRRAASPVSLSPRHRCTFAKFMPPVLLALSLSRRVCSELQILLVLISSILVLVACHGFIWPWRSF